MYTNQNTFKIQLGSTALYLRISDSFDSHRKRWDTPRHCNAEHELHILLSGSCLLDVEEHTFNLSEKEGVIILPNRYHYPDVQSDNFERFSIAFTAPEGFFSNIINKGSSSYITFQITSELTDLCRRIYSEHSLNNTYQSVMLHALLTELTVSILRILNFEDSEKKNQLIKEIARFQTIDGFFNENLADINSEAALAEMLHISKRQLSRILHRHYGMGFRQKLINTRMDRAAWFLRTSDKRISEIAELVGYFSDAAFFQVFKSYFGTTPLQYRKQFKAREKAQK